MGLNTELDKSESLLKITGSSTLSVEDFCNLIKTVNAKTTENDSLSVLLNLTEIDNLELTTKDIEQLSAKCRRTGLASAIDKCAIAVSGDLAYGLGRMFQIMSVKGSCTINIYRDLSEAASFIQT